MYEFGMRPDGFKEIRKQGIIRTGSLFLVIIAIVAILPAVMSDAPNRFDTLPILIPLLLGVMVFSISLSMKRLKPVVESFRLKIDHEKIVRGRLHTPDLIILFTDITRIIKNYDGSFTIQGQSKLNPIAVPAQIEHPDQLEKILNEIQSVEVKTSKTTLQLLAIPISLSGVFLYSVRYITTNETALLTSDILLFLILAVSLVFMQLNKNIDTRTKRLGWFVLLPLIQVGLSVAQRLFS